MEAIRATLEKNTHKNLSLKPITIRFEAEVQETQSKEGVGPGGLHPVFMDPPGPVAVWAWLTDPMYRGATVQARRVMLREKILELTVKVEEECRGAKWRRPKILEQLAAQQSAATSPPQDTWELDRAMATLFEYQKVLIDEANKTVTFIPDDPRKWSRERPTWVVGIGSRAVFHRGDAHDLGGELSAWLEGRESSGWEVRWPSADGTLEEIKKSLAEAGGLQPRCEKPKKQDYADVLGRSQAIRLFAGWAQVARG
jgi:hypothetical protein